MRLWRSSLSALITQALKTDEMQRSTYVISQDTNVRLKTLVKLASWADLGCGPCFVFGAVRPHWYYQNPRPTASGRLRMGLPEFLGNDVNFYQQQAHFAADSILLGLRTCFQVSRRPRTASRWCVSSESLSYDPPHDRAQANDVETPETQFFLHFADGTLSLPSPPARTPTEGCSLSPPVVRLSPRFLLSQRSVRYMWYCSKV